MKNFIRLAREWLNAPINKNMEILEADLHALIALLTKMREEIAESIEKNKVLSFDIAGMVARADRLRGEIKIEPQCLPIRRDIKFEQSLRQLELLNPNIFPVWKELFDNGAKSYVEERLGSCSHREHHHAKLFGMYVEQFGHGLILDIGCGPYSMPSYLAMRDPRQVFGLEPLPIMVDPGYTVTRGFNEFLPWEDGQFDTVVSGTSLDHVLSLDASLSEVRRVLKPSGKYLVWLASIPGAAAFDETAESFEPIDRFHLFHFDRAWVEPVFERYFNIADVTIVPQVGFDHVFYCMEPLPISGKGN